MRMRQQSGIIIFGLITVVTGSAASLTSLTEARIAIDPANVSVPRWSGGALLVVEKQGTQIPVISIFERTGTLQQSLLISIPGPQTVWVRGYSRGTDGTISASGEAFDNDGRVGRFIILFPPNGKAARLIRTGQYGANQVAVAPDGSVWTAGVEALDRKPPGSNDVSAGFAPYLKSAVFRHFDAQGNLIDSFLPQSALANFTNPLQAGSFLAANGSGVAWYCAAEGRYVELTPQGIALDLKGIQSPVKGTAMDGFALTARGRISLSGNTAGQSTLHEFKKATNTWAPVTIDASFNGLYGSDGGNLVTRIRDRFAMRFVSVSE